ncbi:MAG: hypothetical protein MZU84_02455 [Sphingobacterium sp.]|nr:hypothetical protein [Sphingobacterium sp.]
MERHPGKWLRRAAAAVIIAAGGLLAIFSGLRMHERMNDPLCELQRQETYYYYDSQIRMLYEEAEPLLTANPDDQACELALGMGELDSLSAQIIRDLHDNIASQEVLEALITNYMLRIELMQDMLQIMTEEWRQERIKQQEMKYRYSLIALALLQVSLTLAGSDRSLTARPSENPSGQAAMQSWMLTTNTATYISCHSPVDSITVRVEVTASSNTGERTRCDDV